MYWHIRLGFASGSAQQGVVTCIRKLTIMDLFGTLYIHACMLKLIYIDNKLSTFHYIDL